MDQKTRKIIFNKPFAYITLISKCDLKVRVFAQFKQEIKSKK